MLEYLLNTFYNFNEKHSLPHTKINWLVLLQELLFVAILYITPV